MKTLFIIYTEGPSRLETNGQGFIDRGKARDMESEYAYGLVSTGQVQLFDDASKALYAQIRQEKIAAAVKANGTVYCDKCFNEGPALEHAEGFCPMCNPRPAEVGVETVSKEGKE